MRRREVEARLALYDDLAGILGAMRSFALAELHRVTRREEAQQEVMRALADALSAMAPALPPSGAKEGDVWLLLGSVRGFCGSFNEEVVRTWRAAGGEAAPTIVVGERLADLLPAAPAIVALPGALGGLDAPAAIDRILAAIGRARGMPEGGDGLVVCLRDRDGPRCQRLLPLPHAADGTFRQLPFTQQPARQVAMEVANHTLLHDLLALMLRAVRVENQMRLAQMENALRYLDEGRETLNRQRNRLRQEEIVEEIEIMMTKRGRDGAPAATATASSLR